MQQQPQKPDQDSLSTDLRTGVNFFCMLVNTHALCITIFIRHGFGPNRPGLTGVFCLLLMFLVAAQAQDVRMLFMLQLWFLALICQRIRTMWLVSRGWRGHSYYDGYPWLGMLVTGNTSEEKGRSIEPILCLVMGVVLLPFSPTVGTFVMFGFASLTAVRLIQRAAVRRQVTAMQDLEIEQRVLADRIRGFRRDF